MMNQFLNEKFARPLASGALVLLLAVWGAGVRAAEDAAEPDAALPEEASAAVQQGRAEMRKGNWKAGADELKRLLKARPRDPALWNDLGVCHINLKDWPAAEQAFGQAIKADPNYVKAHYNLGVLASRRSQPDEAIAHYRHVLKLNPNYHDALYNLGTVLLKQDKLDEAEAAFQRLVRATRAARFHRAYYNLGLAKAQRNDLRGAIKCYRESLLLNNTHVPSYINLASAYLDLNDYTQAEEALKKAESLEPDNYKVAWNRALVKQKTAGDAAAVPFYEKALKLKPDYAAAAFNLGLIAYRLKRHDTAEQMFTRALTTQKDYAEAHYMLGKLYSDQDEGKKATAAYLSAVTCNPKHFAAWKNLGICYAREQQYDKAWNAMRRAIELKLDDDDAAVYGAGYLKKLGKNKEASELCRKAYAAGAKSPALFRALGQQAAKDGRYDQAVDFYQRAIQLDPTPETCFNLGLALRRQSKWEEAGKAYEKAVRLDPKFAKAWLNLGYVHLHQDRLAEARQAFERALACEPGYDNALSALKELKAAETNRIARPAASNPPKQP